jgi:hypothetical protein
MGCLIEKSDPHDDLTQGLYEARARSEKVFDIAETPGVVFALLLWRLGSLGSNRADRSIAARPAP